MFAVLCVVTAQWVAWGIQFSELVQSAVLWSFVMAMAQVQALSALLL